MTNAEALLGIALPASTEEVKRAYRREISRYHPDKVHHLGKEFQDLAAIKSAQLTEIYRTLMSSGGVDAADELSGVPSTDGDDVGSTNTSSDYVSSAAGATDTADARRPSNRANRVSSWQAVAHGCPSLILDAAIDRLTQSVLSTLPDVEEINVAGFSLAWRTRPKWGRLFTRLPGQGILLRTPSDAPTGNRRLRVRELLPGVQGDIVLFDLVLGLGSEPPAPPPEVVAVAVDAMTWKARVPPEAPEIARAILGRLHSASV